MRVDPKQIKTGKFTGNYLFIGSLQFDGSIIVNNLASELTSTTALFLSSTNAIKTRVLGTMAFLNSTNYYTKTETETKFLPLTGGTVSGTIDLFNLNISQALRLNGSVGYNGQLMKSTGTGQIWAYIGWSEIWDKPAFFDGNYNNLTNKPAFFDGNYNSLTNKPSFFDGNYDNLSNIPFWTIGTNVYNSIGYFYFQSVDASNVRVSGNLNIPNAGNLGDSQINSSTKIFAGQPNPNNTLSYITLFQLKIALNNIQLT